MASRRRKASALNTNPATFVQDALGYARRLADDPTAASFHARLACERFLRDYEETRKDSRWAFDKERATRAMLFASTMPNIKGPLAGQPIQLLDWQKLVYANVFGFIERETGLRRFRQGAVFVPKGNGKTTISAPLAMYMTFGEGEGGAEGYAAAVTRDQARILFDAAKNMARRSDDMRREWGVGILTNSIYQERTASRFVPISSDAKALDGLNVAVAVCDEIGSHRTPEVYDALSTAMGKRSQPFLLSISTATGNNAGIGKQLWDYGMRVLTGAATDDRLFAAIYSVDDDDDLWDEATWIKANPGWGVTVQPDAIRSYMLQARNNVAQENSARTRHLNIWIGADEALFLTRAWNACGDNELQLDDFIGRDCYLGLDLASKTDLAAVSIVFPDRTDSGKPFYNVFARCYLNEAAVIEARNASYPGWAADGDLIVTDGNETDFGRIETDLLDLARRFRIKSIGYDPWAAHQLQQNLRKQGLPMEEFRATTANFSEPTKELDAAMRAGRIRHSGSGPLTWCIGNVVGKSDVRGNIYPRRSEIHPENKVDAAIALIMGIARCMFVKGPSVYETRGLRFLGGEEPADDNQER